MKNPLEIAMRKVLAEFKITDAHFGVGGKHSKLTFEYRGRTFKIPYSGTASDWRAEKNAASLLRRILREADGRR